MNMKRSFRWSASPIAAVIVVAGFLAMACSGGRGGASAAPASTSPAAVQRTGAPATASVSSGSPSPTRTVVEIFDGALQAGTTYIVSDSRVDGPRWVVLKVPAAGWVSNDWIL